jgi:hypothetical protein
MSADQDAFLKEKVFGPVAERVKEKRDSLSRLTRFSRSGIEGWLKVETACALGDCVKKFLNNGPDLKLADELFIELKGATDCNTSYILGGLKYAAQLQYRRIACLFLGSANDISACIRRLELGSRIVAYEKFSVGKDEWIVGLIVPRITAGHI